MRVPDDTFEVSYRDDAVRVRKNERTVEMFIADKRVVWDDWRVFIEMVWEVHKIDLLGFPPPSWVK